MLLRRSKLEIPCAGDALPGRAESMPVPQQHFVNGASLEGPFADSARVAMFGMGCFWGAERLFWDLEGVLSTAAGYAGGATPNPTYGEVCSGRTGHNEVIRVVYDPAVVSYEDLLETFWQGHDPTQGMRQGNDVGTQYRSGIYCSDEEQFRLAKATRDAYAALLRSAGFAAVTTEVIDAPPFYFAEEYHQQYLAKNPGGYCGLGGTGVRCR